LNEAPAGAGLDSNHRFGYRFLVQTGSSYFTNGFAGWFYFSPSSWRLRLR
jgi:hypothetical protein